MRNHPPLLFGHSLPVYSRESRGATVAVIAGLGFSFTGILMRLSTAELWVVIGIRSLLQFAVLALVHRRLPRSFDRTTVISAVAMSVQYFFFAEALWRTTVGSATVLSFTSLLWVPLFARLFTTEKIAKADIVASGGLLLFTTVIFLDDLDFTIVLGNALALACGLVWSVALVTIKQAAAVSDQKLTDSLLLSGLFNMAGSAVVVLYAALPLPSPHALAWCLAAGLQAGLSVVALNAALSRLSSAGVNLILAATEPLFAAIWGTLFLSERLTTAQLIGTLGIVSVLILRATAARAPSRASSEEVHAV